MCNCIAACYLQGYGIQGSLRKLQDTFWTVLKMNWKAWTPFQYINVNYVPIQV